MLFFDSPDPAPNPRRVRIFLAEKGLTLPARTIAITRGEHKGSDYLAINPRGQTPALQLDDGSVLTESVAICRYLDALHPEPPMFGEDARAAGEVEMWSRRAELNLMAAVAQVWIHCHPFTARVNPHRYADWGEVNRDRAVAVMAMFDEQLAGRQWLATDRYTMADILLLTTIDFAQFVGIERPAALINLAAWHERASARPSAAA